MDRQDPSPRGCRDSQTQSKQQTQFSAVPSSVSSVPPVVIVSLIRPVVRKLQINSEISRTQQRDDFLQRVAILAADAHEIALD